MRIWNIVQLVVSFLPTMAWFAGAVEEARDAESESGKKISPNEAATLFEGLTVRLLPHIRSLPSKGSAD